MSNHRTIIHQQRQVQLLYANLRDLWVYLLLQVNKYVKYVVVRTSQSHRVRVYRSALNECPRMRYYQRDPNPSTCTIFTDDPRPKNRKPVFDTIDGNYSSTVVHTRSKRPTATSGRYYSMAEKYNCSIENSKNRVFEYGCRYDNIPLL